MLRLARNATVLALLLLVLPVGIALGQPVLLDSWDSIHIPLGLLADNSGNLYSTCEYGAGPALRKFTVSGTLLAEFGYPFEGYGIAQLSDGTIAVADYYGARVQLYNTGGGIIANWWTGGALAAYLAADEQDNIYVTDVSGNRVRKFTRNGALLASWAATRPTGIAYANGVVYVAAREAGIVTKFDSNGTQLGFFQTGLTAAVQLAIDSDGDLYLADWGGFRLRKFTSDGTILWTLGSSIPGYAYGPLRQHGVAVDNDGTIYVGDYDHNRVLVLTEGGPTPVAGTSWGALKQRYR